MFLIKPHQGELVAIFAGGVCLYSQIVMIMVLTNTNAPPRIERRLSLSSSHITAIGSAKKAIKKDAVKLLQDRKWPGNIREFRNVIERLIILGGKEISAEDVTQYGK